MDHGWDDDPDDMKFQQQFENYYYCCPFSSIGKPHLENGGKIILPSSAIDSLTSLEVNFPYLFAITNPNSGRQSHCGVLEFTAEEGSIIMPEWMMKNMQLQGGDLILIRSTNLEKGTYMKLQPHAKSFLDLSNPRVLLEIQLRNFSCLSAGDTIMVMHDKKRFYIDVVETKPSDAIHIIDTDCEVDFATPLDEKLPEKAIPVTVKPEKDVKLTKEEQKFKPFVGVARRLDGKPMIASMEKEFSQVTVVDNNPKGKGINGKLVFGSGQSNSKELSEVYKQEQKEGALKIEGFQAFTGKKYTLRG